jgi:hypothetical protein
MMGENPERNNKINFTKSGLKKSKNFKPQNGVFQETKGGGVIKGSKILSLLSWREDCGS